MGKKMGLQALKKKEKLKRVVVLLLDVRKNFFY